MTDDDVQSWNAQFRESGRVSYNWECGQSILVRATAIAALDTVNVTAKPFGLEFSRVHSAGFWFSAVIDDAKLAKKLSDALPSGNILAVYLRTDRDVVKIK